LSDGQTKAGREGSLEAPTRHALAWQEPQFYDPDSLQKELDRVFDICHGCRRCFNLCNSFPTLFNLIDESATGELEGVDKRAFGQVVDQCYLCDMCYMTKCPYVPPHPWNVDFPHLMLRAKAVKNRGGAARWRDKVLSSTDLVGNIAGIPVVAEIVNAVNRSSIGRKGLDMTLGVHPAAPVPPYRSNTLRKQLAKRTRPIPAAQAAGGTRGKVALFATCYGNRNEPEIGLDLSVCSSTTASKWPCSIGELLRHAQVRTGRSASRRRIEGENLPPLLAVIERGYDIVAPIPSCVLMFKQELPLMFPDEPDVAKVKQHIFDPFEYLALRHKSGLMRTEFARPLGKIAYHVACHLRVQNIGLKTRDILQLIPGTTVEPIERCSGHNGTYGVKREFRDMSMKIGKPVIERVEASRADFYASDCPMAGHQIESGLAHGSPPTHPLTLLRMAYGLDPA
jgi:Fe-S oxidoreductase